ncbi:unnamed protein product [Lampetra fluviatilis]
MYIYERMHADSARSFTGGAPGYIYAASYMGAEEYKGGSWNVVCARAPAPGECPSWLTTSISFPNTVANVVAIGCSPDESWACDDLYYLWRKPNVDCADTTWVRASGPDAPALPKKIVVDSARGVYLLGTDAHLHHRLELCC